jgi:hypothetical protein
MGSASTPAPAGSARCRPLHKGDRMTDEVSRPPENPGRTCVSLPGLILDRPQAPSRCPASFRRSFSGRPTVPSSRPSKMCRTWTGLPRSAPQLQRSCSRLPKHGRTTSGSGSSWSGTETRSAPDNPAGVRRADRSAATCGGAGTARAAGGARRLAAAAGLPLEAITQKLTKLADPSKVVMIRHRLGSLS